MNDVTVGGELVTVDDIEAAAPRISSVVERTPLQLCERLSQLTGADVYLKREDLQSVRSYKIRGAYNLMAQLSESERAMGVVAASAGNHAQGVAFACKKMGITGRIYVPAHTPRQKCDRIRWHGGDFVELIAIGANYDDAATAALADVQQTGATWIHAFDDPRTVAGQGTIALEVVEQLGNSPDFIVVPVGGGGCLAGITTYLKAQSPETRVIGVEPAGAASLTAALHAGKPVLLPTVETFADGAAVGRIGDLPFRTLANAKVSETPTFEPAANSEVVIRTVDEGAVATAMLDLYQSEGIIAEPAGALAVAALAAMRFSGRPTVVLLISGGNNDVSRYGEVIERSLVHLGVKHYFLVNFPQEPGALRLFLNEVLGPDDDITAFEYVKRNNRETGAALVGIQLGAASDLASLLQRMGDSPLDCERLLPGSSAYRYLT